MKYPRGLPSLNGSSKGHRRSIKGALGFKDLGLGFRDILTVYLFMGSRMFRRLRFRA